MKNRNSKDTKQQKNEVKMEEKFLIKKMKQYQQNQLLPGIPVSSLNHFFFFSYYLVAKRFFLSF